MNIDELRRELALTRQELVGTRKALEASDQRVAELAEENRTLLDKINRALSLLGPPPVPKGRILQLREIEDEHY